jgi:predicted RND superfamily exporter protein
VLMLSQFKTLGQFGLLIALSLLMSAVVGLVVIPVILNWKVKKEAFADFAD